MPTDGYKEKHNHSAPQRKMCENAVNFLIRYVENILHIDEIDTVKKSLIEKSKIFAEELKEINYESNNLKKRRRQ